MKRVLLLALITLSSLFGTGSLMAQSAGTFPSESPQEEVVFYPNPARDVLNIQYPTRGNHMVVVHNVLGEKMLEISPIDTDLVRIDLDKMPKGIYFLSFDQGGKMVTRRFSISQ